MSGPAPQRTNHSIWKCFFSFGHGCDLDAKIWMILRLQVFQISNWILEKKEIKEEYFNLIQKRELYQKKLSTYFWKRKKTFTKVVLKISEISYFYLSKVIFFWNHGGGHAPIHPPPSSLLRSFSPRSFSPLEIPHTSHLRPGPLRGSSYVFFAHITILFAVFRNKPPNITIFCFPPQFCFVKLCAPRFRIRSPVAFVYMTCNFPNKCAAQI